MDIEVMETTAGGGTEVIVIAGRVCILVDMDTDVI
jgi:hypothetical protein